MPWSSSCCGLTFTHSAEQGGRIFRARRHGFHPTGVRTSKVVSKCAERIPCIPLLSPGGLVWCWVPGREGRGAGVNVSRLSSWHLFWSLSLPTVINQKCWTFQQGNHINTALFGASINIWRLFKEKEQFVVLWSWGGANSQVAQLGKKQYLCRFKKSIVLKLSDLISIFQISDYVNRYNYRLELLAKFDSQFVFTYEPCGLKVQYLGIDYHPPPKGKEGNVLACVCVRVFTCLSVNKILYNLQHSESKHWKDIYNWLTCGVDPIDPIATWRT